MWPHDMRRTFVGDLLDRGADIVMVAKLADMKTNARYAVARKKPSAKPPNCCISLLMTDVLFALIPKE